MNTLMGVFDANTGETQLGKRKRPAEDEGGGRELVDGAADDVLATRRGRRTETSEAWEKREINIGRLYFFECSGWLSLKSPALRPCVTSLKQNVERKNREKIIIDKFEVGGRDGGRGRRGDVREWRCDRAPVMAVALGTESAAMTAAAVDDEDGGEGGGEGGELRRGSGSGYHPP
ncbi:hypothetical protein B0H16DRAFT_1465764 [Mycena metata]|uniref:Uncharacterized protein n=1 Tax=Mycena metata TaxID=1033252 RepID=A0AAD7IBU7_9AGAR|nr:hypothetical protein B0H16DRAFT_1465764 [Mycena metata]